MSKEIYTVWLWINSKQTMPVMFTSSYKRAKECAEALKKDAFFKKYAKSDNDINIGADTISNFKKRYGI